LLQHLSSSVLQFVFSLTLRITSASYAVMPDIAQLAKNVAATSAINAAYPGLIGSLLG
jgi:hypothetical protein